MKNFTKKLKSYSKKKLMKKTFIHSSDLIAAWMNKIDKIGCCCCCCCLLLNNEWCCCWCWKSVFETSKQTNEKFQNVQQKKTKTSVNRVQRKFSKVH